MSTYKTAYHHGALKDALLDAGEAMLEEGGPAAVGLREAARRAGVSAMAPYRHFADKEALLVALATRGFQDFGRALREAAETGGKDPLSAMGSAYVHYALAHPGRFRLMFGPAIPDRMSHPELRAAGQAAFTALQAAIERQAGPQGDGIPVRAIRGWAQVHGLAQLLLDGLLAQWEVEELIHAVMY